MFCSKCGKEINQNASFCGNCGNKINTNSQINSTTVLNQPQIPIVNNDFVNVSNDKKNNKGLIVVLSLIVVALICFIVGTVISNFSKKEEDKVYNSRTILIYLCGSDLESKIALGTNDLQTIVESDIDLTKTNVVVYTGGAKQWHNSYISNSENAIYLLTENGFEKKESYQKSSMGKSDTLETFFDYAYENYPADKYDLIMWNHGLGSLGISSDEMYFSDYLSLDELTVALKNSNFSGKNKFETVIFRSCLNSTLEMASIFVPYANYFVASEEVTWGAYGYGIFSFLSDIKLEDSGIDFGKKYIESYTGTLEKIASAYGKTIDEVFGVSTYSIIDLSKLGTVEKSLNSFVSDINLSYDYNIVAKARSNLYQYASESGCNDYDTVDLYSLITEMKSISSSKATSVLNALDEAIVYNWSNNDFSKGLAVYFPYKSASSVRNIHYNSYKNLSGLSNYYSFIKKFDSMQAEAYGDGFSVIRRADIEVGIKDKKVTLKLNDEDIDNYAKASYIIFEKNSNGTFTPVFNSNTFKLGQDVYSLDLNNELIKVINKDTNTSKLVTLYKNELDNYYTDVLLTDDSGTINGRIYLDLKDKVGISKAIMSSTNSSTGMILNINNYSKINFIINNFNVLNNNKLNDDWHSTPIENNFLVSNYDFEKVSLDENYYVMFKIYDVDNLFTYSDLIQIK